MTIQEIPPENPVKKGDLVAYHWKRSYTKANFERVESEGWTCAMVASAYRDGRVKTITTQPNLIPFEVWGHEILVPDQSGPFIPAMRSHYEDPESESFPTLDALRAFLRGDAPVG